MAAPIADAGLKQRHPHASVPTSDEPTETTTTTTKQTNGRPKLTSRTSSHHPAGKVKHGAVMQFLRMCAFAAYFNGSIIAYVQHSHPQSHLPY